jgi:hypothetical protein
MAGRREGELDESRKEEVLKGRGVGRADKEFMEEYWIGHKKFRTRLVCGGT